MAAKIKTDYTDQPIYWIVRLLKARERSNAYAEREAQDRLRRLGVHIRFDSASTPMLEAKP